MDKFHYIFGFALIIFGFVVGVIGTLLMVARDKTIVRLKDGETIVVHEELMKLIKQARSRRRMVSDEEEEEEAPTS